MELVYRLAYNGDVAAGQLAVFQGGPSRTGGKAPISESYGSSEQRRKTANWPPARRVALKMGRRLGKRVGGSAYWRIGVWGSKTAFRHGYNDQEVSTELMMLCKRRHADTPIRRYADTFPLRGPF